MSWRTVASSEATHKPVISAADNPDGESLRKSEAFFRYTCEAEYLRRTSKMAFQQVFKVRHTASNCNRIQRAAKYLAVPWPFASTMLQVTLANALPSYF